MSGFLGRGAFGMPYGQCPDCRRMVYFKPFLGTLHVCLSPEERRQIQQGRWQAEQQRRMMEQPGAAYTNLWLSAGTLTVPNAAPSPLEDKPGAA